MTATIAEPVVGQAVMTSARGRYPRVVHQLARIKEGAVLYPYEMACGYASTSTHEVEDGAPPCGRCWS